MGWAHQHCAGDAAGESALRLRRFLSNAAGAGGCYMILICHHGEVRVRFAEAALMTPWRLFF